jgi:hypothetical protein
MTQRLPRTRRARAAAVLAAATLALTAAACSGGDGGSEAPAATTAPAAAARPSSPAKLTIMSPRNGQTVGERAELRLDLDGGKIVNQTTTRVQGDEGHIHLHVEFVAADHAPFDPRVLNQAAFQVAE